MYTLGRRGRGTPWKNGSVTPSLPPTTHKGETMSRRKRNGNKIKEPFVPILKPMVNSLAFKKLTNAQRVAYLLLKCQCKEAGQREVIFPFSHAESYMDRHTFGKAIKRLIELGFILKTDFGGLYRRTNVYKFIDDWRKIK